MEEQQVTPVTSTQVGFMVSGILLQATKSILSHTMIVRVHKIIS